MQSDRDQYLKDDGLGSADVEDGEYDRYEECNYERGRAFILDLALVCDYSVEKSTCEIEHKRRRDE